MPRQKQVETEEKKEIVDQGASNNLESSKTEAKISPELIQSLLTKIESLERKDVQNQEQMKMLLDVADKGRVFNYQSTKVDKKPFLVKLSEFNGGIVVGWQTLKDVLVKHPTTGLIVGEEQEYEVRILKDGKEETVKVQGYPAFSDLRYQNRIEAEVIGKKEDWNGNVTFQLKTRDGKTLELDSRFVN